MTLNIIDFGIGTRYQKGLNRLTTKSGTVREILYYYVK